MNVPTLGYAERMPRDDGLTELEGEVMDALSEAVACFDALPIQHPQEAAEFYSAIHRAQDLLAARLARALRPAGWVDYSKERELS